MAGVSFSNYIILFFFTNVTPWTIDLPEIRKIVFENNERYNNIDDNDKIDIKGQFYYTNREGNSLHNSKHYEDVYENSPYAKEYGYQSYMEKKVNSIVYNGSLYLDGLQRSLENFTRTLEECQRMNTTNNTSWRPASESSRNVTLSRCENATRASEHVRRLSQLAMWTTRELQDIAYSKKYKKGDIYDITAEENELILKLAWFLDRLAHYTGYEPEHTDLVNEDTETSTTTTSPSTTMLSIMNAPEPVKRLMMDCLRENSSEPATVRCAYNEPMPPLAMLLLNYSDDAARQLFSPPTASSSNINEQSLSFTQQITPNNGNDELLEASEFDPTKILPPYVKSVQKRSIFSMPKPDMTKMPPLSAVKVKKRANLKDKLSKVKLLSAVKIKKRGLFKVMNKKVKRSIYENPAINFLKYYAKTKAWLNDNTDIDKDSILKQYEVGNHLNEHRITKRAIDKLVSKKYDYLKPENPFQDLSQYIKHKQGTNYVKDEEQAAKVRKYLEKISVTLTAKPSLLSKLAPKRAKRSVKFENDVDKPRNSENPQQDLSYYVKNKPGTSISPNVLQAGQVRAGLEQIFLTPNIEVVRRYGANVNPLIPAPFYFGALKGMADNL